MINTDMYLILIISNNTPTFKFFFLINLILDIPFLNIAKWQNWYIYILNHVLTLINVV